MNIPVSLAFLVAAETREKSEGKSVTIKVDHLRTSMSNDQESAAKEEITMKFELNGVLTLVYFTRLDLFIKLKECWSWKKRLCVWPRVKRRRRRNANAATLVLHMHSRVFCVSAAHFCARLENCCKQISLVHRPRQGYDGYGPPLSKRISIHDGLTVHLLIHRWEENEEKSHLSANKYSKKMRSSS